MKKIKKRKYNLRRISLTMSYSVQELSELFDIHKNTVLRWIKDGLATIDNKKPYLIHGGILKTFLFEKQKSRKANCKSNEFYCFKCRCPRSALSESVRISRRNEYRIKIQGLCKMCNTKMYRDDSAENFQDIQKIFSTVKQLEKRISDESKPCLNDEIERNL